ncbi:hypothetical protein [Nonomuraea sp. B19D2]|uniref:hypothetical protein n=1 Tax=Nonomuraea sp. B19D2 TaxID=3159561 RepID=UPI0032DA8738
MLAALLLFVAPDSSGLGDVKTAGLVGEATGYFGLSAWLVGVIYGPILGGIYSGTRRRGAEGKVQFPYGPFLPAGVLVALLLIGP